MLFFSWEPNGKELRLVVIHYAGRCKQQLDGEDGR
jgi:hypothetical protein